MSAENSSEHDEVIALMAQEGISRVKATKLLYELAKQKKKDAAKIELNINQGDNSTVKNQIERFSSQRDLSNASNQVHRDIDLSEEGRPVLKLDGEASFRYNSSGPHPPVPTEYVAPAHEPYQRQKSMRSSPQRSMPPVQGQGGQGQQSPGQGQRERADTYGSSEDEAVVPYDEDKPFPDSPPPSRNHRGVAGGGGSNNINNNNNDYGGWNGVLEEDSPNAATACMPNPAPKRRSSSSALNLRPLSRLHPNKFRDSLSPEEQDCDYDEEDSGSDYDVNERRQRDMDREQEERDGYRSGDTSDGEASALDGDRLDAFGAANLAFSQSASPLPTPTNRNGGPGKHPTMVPPAGARGGIASGGSSTTHTTTATAATSSSTTSTTTTSTNFTSSNHLPQGQHQQQQGQQGQSQFQRRAHERDDSSDSDGSPLPPPQYSSKDNKSSNPNPRTSSPPGYQEQQQRAFAASGANDSWSAGSPSQSGASSESKSFSQSSANVQQLAVEEKLALLNAGRSSANAGGLGSPAPLSAPSATTAGLMGPPSSSATTKVLGSKKLTIRAASAAILATTSTNSNSSSAGQALMSEEHQQHQQHQDPQPQQRDLPPPPPSYEDIATTGTSTPPPMYSPQQQPRRRPSQSGSNMDMPQVADEPLPDYLSDGEDQDGLTQEQRTAALMAKYKRRSYMRPDNTPEAFRNLDPVDPAQIEEMMRQEQERKEAAAAAIAAGRAPSPVPFSSSANGPSTPPHSNNSSSNEVVYVTEAPTERAVEAVMHKESADLVEELVAQGYSRENAISLAKEIELDRRAGRFGSGGPRSSYGDASSVGNTAPNSATSHSNFGNDFSPQRPGLPRHGQQQQGGSGASVASQSSSYNNAHAWGNNSANSAYYSSTNHAGSYKDDDCGSVISQISGVSRQSAGSFCESDKLLMNLLLSQQKARYGVNMYESLSNSDEPSIERYMGRGLSLDQAVLKVFEKKFGPVDNNQAMPRNLQSTSSKVSTTSSAAQYDSAEAHEIVSTMHAEIELLMLSGDYSREVAVRMLLNKVARERAQQALGGLSIDSDNHSHQLQRSMSMSGMGSPKGRSSASVSGSVRGGGYQGQGQGQGGEQYSEADFRSGGMHSARSMYDASSSSAFRGAGNGGGGASVISERSSGRQQQDVPMPHHHPGDHHHNQHQNDYIAQYHQQEYSRGPNGSGGGSVKGGDQYIIHHHYQNAPGGKDRDRDRDRDREHRRRPSASGGSVRTANSGTSRTVDDREYLPTLLQEQEATYGVNMFEYLAPDDPEVSRLMNEFNFSRTDAMIAVFQQFPPVVSSPAPGGMGSSNSRAGGGGSRSHHHRNLSGGSSSNVGSPRKPGNNTNPSSGGSHNSGANGNNFFPPTPSSSGPSRSQYDEDAELERVMKLSMQEVAERPGAVSMPGPGSSMSTSSGRSGGSSGGGGGGGYGSQYNMHHSNHSGHSGGGGGGGASSQDVAALVGMGFTSAQAHDALARHHFDVHKAANYLLGGA